MDKRGGCVSEETLMFAQRWLSNWKNRRVAGAYRTMADALQRDCEYADVWGANIAMTIFDGAGGKLTYLEANAIADKLMARLWSVAPKAMSRETVSEFLESVRLACICESDGGGHA